MSTVTRSLRSASKQLRVQPTRLAANLSLRSASVGAARVSGSIAAARNFSSSITRLSGAPNMAPASREYDPEIKDIADYVANKPIDSELAVRISLCFPCLALVTPPSKTQRPNNFNSSQLHKDITR